MGHAHPQRLKELHERGALGLSFPKDTPHNAKCKCEHCLMCNNVKRSIPNIRSINPEISRKGQLLTTDLMGPFPPSPEGHRYVIAFTDEYTRHSTCYFLKNKNEAADALIAVIRYYKMMNIIIGSIRSDQGGEFGGHHDRPALSGGSAPPDLLLSLSSENTKFLAVCSKHDITHIPMPAYVPQLHGIAERWNKTVMNIANSMLYAACISPVLWSSAIAHANTFRNRLPTRVLGDLTPYELFVGSRPRYDNLRVWGCYCYKLLPVRHKIPGLPVRVRLLYVGETPERVGFRCFNPVTFQFTTEFELIFDEESIFDRQKQLDSYDNRRELAESGQHDKIPLVFDHKTAEDQLPHVRSLYLSPTEYERNLDSVPVDVSTSPDYTRTFNHSTTDSVRSDLGSLTTEHGSIQQSVQDFVPQRPALLQARQNGSIY